MRENRLLRLFSQGQLKQQGCVGPIIGLHMREGDSCAKQQHRPACVRHIGWVLRALTQADFAANPHTKQTRVCVLLATDSQTIVDDAHALVAETGSHLQIYSLSFDRSQYSSAKN